MTSTQFKHRTTRFAKSVGWRNVFAVSLSVLTAFNGVHAQTIKTASAIPDSGQTTKREQFIALPKYARNDDGVTTYSSRGSTRSFWTDASGVKHYDNLIKPDLVAPGNKMVSGESLDNLLVRQYPQLDTTPPATSDEDHPLMRLNGSSMAAPIVAGAAALLLQANPKLTPNMVKMILMFTAQSLAGYNTLEQGSNDGVVLNDTTMAQSTMINGDPGN